VARIIVTNVNTNAKINASGRYRCTRALAPSPSAVKKPLFDPVLALIVLPPCGNDKLW
jgi:hypothetical protein